MKDLDLIPVLGWRRALPGELGGGGLWSMVPERTFLALDKSVLVERIMREVNASRLPGMALASVDSGVSRDLLKQVGYTAEALAKAEAEVEDLLKSQSRSGPRKSRRTIQIDEEEHTRLKKLEAVVERFLRSGGPGLRGVTDD